MTEQLDLKEALKKEKNAKVVPRIYAVRLVQEHNYTIKETDDILCKSESWVKYWVQRFQEDGERTGTSCLYDHPKTGRPSSHRYGKENHS